MKKSKWLGLVMSVVLSLSLVACGSSTTSSNQNLVKVGLNVGYVPWEFMEGDKLVGVEVDIISEAAKRLNKEVEWITTPWSGLFAGLLAEKFQIAAAGITIKPDRMKEMDFTAPYYDSDQSLTTKVDSGIKSLEDMKGKILGVESGTTGDQWAQDNKDKYGFQEIKLYNSLQDAMMDLSAGRIHGEISDIPASLYYTKDKNDIKVVERIVTNEKYGLAFKKDDPLRDEFNRVMDEMKKDGTMAAIYKKWFGEDAPSDSSTVTIVPVPSN
ncbi:ABC transporter substrate-binding protein [Ammoniphilus sp. CFH 90114]|uniref:ABC transporter substrate-binding protein n=1 Tax=Ammoniphilus sp. CFH 90114 TaxID=2493665 RepID=UPI00100DE81D|nr:ABC transporter substrate-binding protein [Ammoniphilus sp. CFH 90114]RXT07102.1 amino acid ABC transporter substrate-binding protein [Ammoniphilus sp. CFH 90114]